MKLLKITTLLITVLSLTHCRFTKKLMDDDMADALVTLVATETEPSVSEKIGCPNLDGAYKTSTDLIFNFIPLNQSYNVNIASGAKDVIVQIKSVDEDEEKNVVCTIFSDVGLSEEPTLYLNLLQQSGTTSMVADTNVKKFVNKLSFLRFKKSEESCVAKELFAGKLDSMKYSKIALTPDAERSAKSFKTIKEECGRLVLVETDEEEAEVTTEDVVEAAPAEAAPVKEAPAEEEFVGPPAS